MTTFKKIIVLMLLVAIFISIQEKACFAQKILGGINVKVEMEKLKKEFKPIMIELHTYNWEAVGSLYLIKESGEFVVCMKRHGILGPCHRGKLSVDELKGLKQLITRKEISLWKEEYKSNKPVNRLNAGGYTLVVAKDGIKKKIFANYLADVPQKLKELFEKIKKLTKKGKI